jgi:hypothetical protein
MIEIDGSQGEGGRYTLPINLSELHLMSHSDEEVLRAPLDECRTGRVLCEECHLEHFPIKWSPLDRQEMRPGKRL